MHAIESLSTEAEAAPRVDALLHLMRLVPDAITAPELLVAACASDWMLPITRAMLTAGAPVNGATADYIDNTGDLPDIYEVQTVLYVPIVKAIYAQCPATIKFLLDYGAKTRGLEGNSTTAMYIAASTVNLDIIKLVAEYDDDVCTTVDGGYTPMHRAVMSWNVQNRAFNEYCTRFIGVIEYLRQLGADPTARTNTGATPLDMLHSRYARDDVKAALS